MSVCATGWWDRGPPGVGCDLLLPALWRSECSHAGCEQNATSARRLQDLVSGVHEQPWQTVRTPQLLVFMYLYMLRCPHGSRKVKPHCNFSLLLSSVSPLDPFAAASPRLQRTSFASTTAECWGTALTPTREPSTAWSGNVTSVITMGRWQTRLKTTSGLRCSILHFSVLHFGLFSAVWALARCPEQKLPPLNDHH